MKREHITAAVMSVAASLVWAGLASAQVAPLEGYADDTPNNNIPTSTMNTERGGTLKSADPRPIPGTDPRAGQSDAEARRRASREGRSAETATYRPAPTNYDNDSRRVVVPAPIVVTPSQARSSMQNDAYASDGVDYRYIKPADPAVVNPDSRHNGGVDRVLASDRYLKNHPDVTGPFVPSQAAGRPAPSDELAVKRDYSTHPLDSTRDPAFRRPGVAGQDTAAPFEQNAQPAGGRVAPETLRTPSEGATPGSSGDNSALDRNNRNAAPNAAPSTEASQNDATLDLPGIRTSLSGFVDAALGGAGSGNWVDMIARSDRERLGSAGTSADEELTRLSTELRDTWRTKYGTEIRGNNTTIAVADGFRIVSPGMLDARPNEARLAGERAAPNTQGQEPQPQQPQPRMRTEASGSGGDRAVVIIPVAAICVDLGASPRGAGPATPDVNAGAADRARGALAEGAGTAVEKAGEADNRVGPDGNRLGNDLNRAGDTMQQQGRQLQDRGDDKARAHGGKYATVAERRVRLVREDGQWRIDLPDAKDGPAFRRELTDNLRALSARKEQWPADQADAYRMLAAHVLGAAAE